jgi:hypothetical protein
MTDRTQASGSREGNRGALRAGGTNRGRAEMPDDPSKTLLEVGSFHDSPHRRAPRHGGRVGRGEVVNAAMSAALSDEGGDTGGAV